MKVTQLGTVGVWTKTKEGITKKRIWANNKGYRGWEWNEKENNE